jgi:hypothetical protein
LAPRVLTTSILNVREPGVEIQVILTKRSSPFTFLPDALRFNGGLIG